MIRTIENSLLCLNNSYLNVNRNIQILFQLKLKKFFEN
jgi:hypothetical protein